MSGKGIAIKRYLNFSFALTQPAWDGVMFLHEGPYSGTVLKMRLLIPGDYPSTTIPVGDVKEKVE